MVDFARFAGLQDEADPRPGAGSDEVMVEAGRGQQGRDGRVLTIHALVGQNEDRRPIGNGPIGSLVQCLQGLFEAGSAAAGRKQDRQAGDAQTILVEAAQLFQLSVAQDRAWQA